MCLIRIFTSTFSNDNKPCKWLFTAYVKLRAVVCSALYFIWSRSMQQKGLKRTVATGRIYVTEKKCRVNQNERHTSYSPVLTCLTTVFGDSTGLFYCACLT